MVHWSSSRVLLANGLLSVCHCLSKSVNLMTKENYPRLQILKCFHKGSFWSISSFSLFTWKTEVSQLFHHTAQHHYTTTATCALDFQLFSSSADTFKSTETSFHSPERASICKCCTMVQTRLQFLQGSKEKERNVC